MRLTRNIAVALAAMAFGAAPAVALANGDGGTGKTTAPGQTKSTSSTSNKSNTSNPSNTKAKDYGADCQGMSKTHQSGTKGTPFSQCVIAMEKLAKNSKMSASAACKGMSKTHMKGQKGTAFSECVEAAADLRSSTK